jgi:hypothetical protein
MTAHELARLLLAQPDKEVMVIIDDWVYAPDGVEALGVDYTRQGTVIISVGNGEIIE